MLQAIKLDLGAEFIERLTNISADAIIDEYPLPWRFEDFHELRSRFRDRLIPELLERDAAAAELIARGIAVKDKLLQSAHRLPGRARSDMNEQLLKLFRADFMRAEMAGMRARYPIYLDALAVRIERAAANPGDHDPRRVRVEHHRDIERGG